MNTGDMKVALHKAIVEQITTLGLNQSETGKIIGVGQPHVSALINGRLELYSIQRLIEYAIKLGLTINVSIN